ncbi:DNA-binding protein [Methylobacterium sp. NEAU K]|uniref:DNA-binding protein n=1 Tax=Methylobacterium sp. NEAU K TaxID=3064946 RepID=UPI00273375FD|nr:DNA-binding protein [Methylobacterium sp. NEAU K]MDP4006398.1 DNA-binding protein [Methylobacterium sp. NEAU K]
MNASSSRPSEANDVGLPLAKDLMTGAEAIARFMFGDASETNKRRVYHAASELGLPTFRIGATLCARRTTILAWITKQEQQGSEA